MALRLKRRTGTPIALDLGTACTRLLQRDADDPSRIAAAAQCLHADPHGAGPARFDLGDYLSRVSTWLGQALGNDSDFTGRRVVATMPSSLVSMQHIKLEPGEDQDLAVHTRLSDIGDEPMVRCIDISSPLGSTRGCRDLMCLAMPRAAVMRTVQMFHEFGLEVDGLYTPASMMVRAFGHINQRESDQDEATMYVDLGSARSTIALGHGGRLVLARSVGCSLGNNQHAPQATSEVPVVAQGTNSADDVLDVINRRAGEPNPSMPGIDAVDGPMTDACIDELVEELHMSRRYHASLFGEVPVRRVVFTGGAAHDTDACRSIAQALNLPAQVGDPLARWDATDARTDMTDWSSQLRPQWTVAAGLASLHDEDADS